MPTVAWFSGFEGGNVTSGNGSTASSGTFSANSSVARTGTYSLRCNPATTAVGYVGYGYISRSSGLPITTGALTPTVCGFGFRVDTLPGSGSEDIWSGLSNTTPGTAFLRITSAGNLQLYNANGTTQTGSDSTTALSTGTWYYIEVSIAAGSAGACVGSVKINGTTEISTSTATFATAAGSFDGVTFGKVVNRNGNSVDYYYDDCYWANDFLGICYVKAALPTGAGTNNTFTAGTGSANYLECDETPSDSATTYVQSTATNQFHGFAMQSTSTVGISPSTIHCVASISRIGRVGAGALYRPWGYLTVDSYSWGVTGNSSISTYNDYWLIAELNPFDSSAWTTADVDGFEVGAEDVNTSTARVRLSTVKWHVLYSVSGGNTYDESITETVTAGEGVTNIATLNNSLTETVTTGESLATTADLNVAISATVTVDESLTTTAVLSVSITEAVTPGDGSTTGGIVEDSITEATTVGETLSASQILAEALAEVITAGESLSTTGTLVAALTEAISVNEVLGDNAVLATAIAEAITLGDSLVTEVIPSGGGPTYTDKSTISIINNVGSGISKVQIKVVGGSLNEYTGTGGPDVTLNQYTQS